LPAELQCVAAEPLQDDLDDLQMSGTSSGSTRPENPVDLCDLLL